MDFQGWPCRLPSNALILYARFMTALAGACVPLRFGLRTLRAKVNEWYSGQ